MVTAAVDNHCVENSRDTLSKFHSACAACNVRLLCSEEDMAEGGCDSSGPHSMFYAFKETKSEIWEYFSVYKNAQGQLVEDGSPVCGSCKKKVVARGGNTSSLRDHHPQLFSKCKVS